MGIYEEAISGPRPYKSSERLYRSEAHQLILGWGIIECIWGGNIFSEIPQ